MKIYNLKITGEVLSSKYELSKLVFAIRINYTTNLISKIVQTHRRSELTTNKNFCDSNLDFPKMSVEKFLSFFPFHIVLKKNMQIKNVGKSILGVRTNDNLADGKIIGQMFDEVFETQKIFRRGHETTWDEVSFDNSLLFQR